LAHAIWIKPSVGETAFNVRAIFSRRIAGAMKRKTRTFYSKAFKMEALRMVAAGDRSKTQIANDLGIRANKLRYWSLEFKQANSADATTTVAVEVIATLQQGKKAVSKLKAAKKRPPQIGPKKSRNTGSAPAASIKNPRK
jgi:transposase-like protein